MKLKYYLKTNSLYIELSSTPGVQSDEVSKGMVLDYDASGKMDGISIDNADGKIDMQEITISNLPA